MTRRRLAYSVGFTLPAHTPDLLEHIDEAQAWTPAYDTDTDGIREGAWVAELTGLLDLSGWPAGMRVIVRKERPTPERNYGSPITKECASPRSPPTPRAASYPSSSCVTAAAHDAKTGSATPRTWA